MPEFQHRQLDNGLTVLAEPHPQAHTAAVGFFVNTGARDETPPIMGVSHFLEHMMFKGTSERTADDVNREFDEIGANYNAFTSHEETVFYAHVLPEYLPKAVDLLGDILRPALRDDDFDMEKNVILEEIGMYDDRPQWRLHDAILEQYFKRHPLGFRVLGTTDTVGGLTAEQMRNYFTQRYSPDNIIVACAGQVDFDQFCKDVETRTAAWQPTGTQRTHGEPAPTDAEQTLVDSKLNRFYLGLMWPGPSAQDERRYAAKVLADVLGDAGGSRLYWALVDPGIAEEADASFYPMDQTGAFFAYASCDPKRAEQVEHTMADVIRDFGMDLQDSEIEQARNKIATHATLQGELPIGRMLSLGGQWLYLGEYRTLDEEIEQLHQVTADDVRALLKAYPFERVSKLRLTPEQ